MGLLNQYALKELGLAMISLDMADGVTTYIATGPRTAGVTDAVWDCQKIVKSTVGSDSMTRVTWCATLAAPGANGANLAGLTYA